MIYTDGTSELHIRLHIAEILKDKVEQPNYNELCEKALQFIMKGIELPKIKKTPVEEATDIYKTFLINNPIQDALKELRSEYLPKTKEEELKELTNKHLNQLVTYKNISCHICGYSVEFNCLIAGTFENYEKGILLGSTDCILSKTFFNQYLYVPKDIINKI